MNRPNTMNSGKGDVLSPEGPGRVAVTMQSSLLGFYTHAGFLNALIDSGVRPSKVSGSSAGALAAAAYASGLEGGELKSFILDPRLQGTFHEWSAVVRALAVLICYRG
ncbi:MAG: patatin-like phospholipase family protein, partial [Verrucomicrobiae bacterium]|nr:patatin-like phospholipase family protein [Verrucomicrobiae bacterium]NNJ85821.1 hypothetical protein [Akkermansiaceae bacterium]